MFRKGLSPVSPPCTCGEKMGDSACDQFIPVEVVSTFEREPETPEPLAPVVPLFKEGDK